MAALDRDCLNVAGTGHVSCNGEDVCHHGRTLKQTVVLQETHFTIKTVRIRKNFDSGALMIVESGTTIPANLIKQGGFSIDSGTYITPQVRVPCAYKVIKSFRGTATPTDIQDDLAITSQKDQVHIHTHGMLNPPPRCPIQGTYRKTGHPNIVVFQPSDGPISTDNVGFRCTTSVNTKYGNSKSGVGILQNFEKIWTSTQHFKTS